MDVRSVPRGWPWTPAARNAKLPRFQLLSAWRDRQLQDTGSVKSDFDMY